MAFVNVSPPTGAWVKPIRFGLETKNVLRRWLDLSQVNALEQIAEIEAHLNHLGKAEPTLGEHKLVLKQASAMAIELATILGNASSIAEGEFLRVFHEHVGGHQELQNMVNNLTLLSHGISASLERLPTQGRRNSHTRFVRLIADVLVTVGISPSVAKNSRFYIICKSVFDSAGIPQDPAAAIRNYIAEKATE